jgi:hypothetical protein
MDPTLFALAPTITFPFARSSPPNDPLQQFARKNEPDRKFFFGHTLLDLDRPDAASNSYATCKFGPPRINFAPPCPPNHLSPMHSNQLPSILVSAPSKKYPSVFFRSPSGPTRSGTLCTRLASPPPTHRMERIRFSAAYLHSSSLRSVYIITTQFFVLRSSFYFSRNLKNGPLSLLPPPLHVGL